MYDNVKEEYDNIIGLNDAMMETTQSEISALEANGKYASQSLYEGLQASTVAQKETILAEIADLNAKASNFEVDSDEWYQWKNDIESATQSLYQCDETLAELQKDINEIKLRPFELMNTELENANAQVDFLISYLSHKDLTSKDAAGLTNEGFATIALNFSGIEHNQQMVENLQNELAEFDRQVQNGTTNLTQEEITEKYEGIYEGLRNAMSATEDYKDSILDLVENAFDVQLDALDELIEKRKKALENEKD
jgi:hypothetical protein